METPSFQLQREHGGSARRLMTPHFDMSLPAYSTHGVEYHLPFQPLHYGNAPAPATYCQYSTNVAQHTATAPQSFGVSQHIQFSREAQHMTVQPRHYVKAESDTSQPSPSILRSNDSIAPGAPERTFGTDIDTLMRTIQTRTGGNPQRSDIKPMRVPDNEIGSENSAHRQSDGRVMHRSRKKYQCHIASCAKCFFQKTHLEIHLRAHTGFKPFLCKEQNCGQKFSQLGNLKTHERRHSGERPYSCEECGKRFAQRGNMRAHRIVHEQTKPFTCKLEGCGKNFTQLGNLKSHQNKFHAEELRLLTTKFATMREGDSVTNTERELWEYFSALYKNSNKGIKGRGKDTRLSNAISPSSQSQNGHRRGSPGSSTGDSEQADAYGRGNGDQDNDNVSEVSLGRGERTYGTKEIVRSYNGLNS